MPRAKTSFKIKGMPQLQAELRRIAKKFPDKARGALYRAAETQIMTPSKRDYCPVDDGILRSSGHVVVEDKKLGVTLGYGGPAGIGNVGGETNDKAVGYAIVQHEELSYAHTVGEAEYLKKPMDAAVPTLAKDIAADIALDEL